MTDVAKGVCDTDAVNVSQLNDSVKSILNSSSTYMNNSAAGILESTSTYTDNSAASTLKSANGFVE
ncbi:hypothetical protein [Symbiopectobacterium purcellii]|uniref:hypothetical protein n=1 Tax=Symbiopectobacterium purcellii TaxID=2871826 RepID=UPI003F8304A6